MTNYVVNPKDFKDVTTPAPELANGRWESRDHYGYGTGRRFCPGAHLAGIVSPFFFDAWALI